MSEAACGFKDHSPPAIAALAVSIQLRSAAVLGRSKVVAPEVSDLAQGFGGHIW